MSKRLPIQIKRLIDRIERAGHNQGVIYKLPLPKKYFILQNKAKKIKNQLIEAIKSYGGDHE